MEKYYGNYLGIVVNTNDPESRNRIQVWVPNLTNTLYSNWNTDFNNKIIDYNGYKVQNNDYKRLINALPWAECASPLIGGGTAMNINPAVKNKENGSTVDVPVEEPSTPSGETTILDNGQVVDSKTGEPIFDPNVTDIPSAELPVDENGVVQIFDESSTEGSNQSTDQIVEGEDGIPRNEPDLPVKENDDDDDIPVAVASVATAIGVDGNPEGISPPNVNIQRYRSTLPSQQYGAGRNRPDPHAGIDLDNSPNAVSFIGGVVTRVGYDAGGYGHYVDIYNKELGVVERVAEYTNPYVKLGDDIMPYQIIGEGVTQTGVIHYEIRTDLNNNNQGGFGFKGTTDPVKYLNALGIDPYSEQTATTIASQQTNQFTGESNPAPITNSLDRSITAQGNPSPAGAAKGVISCPSEGARVWVFFYGGDIQKPVYFAMSITGPEYQTV